MKNFTFNGIAIKLVAIAVLLAITISCSKEKIPDVFYYNNITSFTFNKGDNPSLTENCTSFQGGDVLYVTVPEGTAITSLKPNITVSPEATITINGTAVVGAIPAIDFSGVVKITVTSKTGINRLLKVLVKPGLNQLDQMIYELMSKYSIPGVSFAISKDEKTVYESGVGFAIVENDERTRPDHLFRLASISKQFTTLCIMKLKEQGKLTVDDNVFGPGGHLEQEFPTVKATDKAARVTIRHLLSHTSGWTSSPNDPMFDSGFKGQTLDERIVYMLASAQGEPGATHSYYNMGFGVLGKIVEKLSGKNFEVFMKEILATAGVTDIHVGGDRGQRRLNEAVYYSQDGTNGYGNEMDVIAAAGGIIASPREMLKLLYHIDGLPGIPDIITPATRTLMLTKINVLGEDGLPYDRYALGWRTNHRLFPGASFHTGNLAGTATFWVMGRQFENSVPKFNCVILCNSRSYLKDLDKSTFDDYLYVLMSKVINTAQTMIW